MHKTPGESAMKQQSTERYKTVHAVFEVPEAVIVGPDFGQ